MSIVEHVAQHIANSDADNRSRFRRAARSIAEKHDSICAPELADILRAAKRSPEELAALVDIHTQRAAAEHRLKTAEDEVTQAQKRADDANAAYQASLAECTRLRTAAENARHTAEHFVSRRNTDIRLLSETADVAGE
jgi:septal ring factor EnvC (AmiA/AmiB activator)